MSSSVNSRVFVSGLGVVSAHACQVDEFWRRIISSESAISNLENLPVDDLAIKFGGEIKNFQGEAVLEKKLLRRIDRFVQLALVAAIDALEASGIEKRIESKRIGIFISSGVGGLTTIQQAVLARNNGKRVSPFFIPGVISNIASGYLSQLRKIEGPNYCITSACSSSAHALGEAMRMIRHGYLDAAIVGGAEAPLNDIAIAGFSSMNALSKRNEEPQKASRPFDVNRDGFVMSEGAGVLILESEKFTQDPVAEMIGYGTNSDAHHITSPPENGSGARACMEQCFEDANFDPSQLDYVNMHGTSTRVGDVAESRAIESCIPHALSGLHCSSTKSMTGHLLGAAASLEAIICCLALKNGIIPATINLNDQDPECRLNYTPHKSIEKEMNYALSNSFGFGGTNASLLFKKV